MKEKVYYRAINMYYMYPYLVFQSSVLRILSTNVIHYTLPYKHISVDVNLVFFYLAASLLVPLID